MAELHTEYLPLYELIDMSALRNARGHDIETTKASIRRFGFMQSIVLDERTKRIIAGHGRRDALAEMHAAGEAPPNGVRVLDSGEWVVPVERGWASADDTEADAVGIALNRVGENRWHRDVLSEMLDDLSRTDQGLDGIGFDRYDLDAMLVDMERERAAGDGIDTSNVAAPKNEDRIHPPDEPITQHGDVWLLGSHRLVCGDCRELEVVRNAVGDRKVNVAFTSPPYASQREYDEESGFKPIPEDEYVEWFKPVSAAVKEVLAADGSWFINIKPSAHGDDTNLYVFDLVIAHVREWGWHFATEFCWERLGVPKRVERRFKNQFEPVYQFSLGRWKFRPDHVRHVSDHALLPLGPGSMKAIAEAGSDADWDHIQGTGTNMFPAIGKRAQPRINPVSGVGEAEQGQGGTYGPGAAKMTGYAYPGNRLPTFGGTHEAVGHAAAFPVGLPAWFVRAFSDEGDVVLDPFLGSGSTIIAAHESDRIGCGIELSPAYCDVIAARFQRRTGITPVRERDAAEVDVLAHVLRDASRPTA